MPKRKQSPNQLKNLKPPQWVKGQSGNPKGRPKELPDLKVLLAKVLGEERNDLTAAEAILKGLVAKAVKGDVRAAELLLDRGYGKIKQDIHLDGKPLLAPVILRPSSDQLEPKAG